MGGRVTEAGIAWSLDCSQAGDQLLVALPEWIQRLPVDCQ